jgi:hypothetical protein
MGWQGRETEAVRRMSREQSRQEICSSDGVLRIRLTSELCTTSIPLRPAHPVSPYQASLGVIPQALHRTPVDEGRLAAEMYRVQHTSERVQVVRRVECRVERIFGGFRQR